MRMLARSIVGSRDTVRAGIEALVAETAADELIVVSDVYDHAARLRSFERVADPACAAACARSAATDAGHGRIEERTCRVAEASWLAERHPVSARGRCRAG
jgi:hypothetical protein